MAGEGSLACRRNTSAAGRRGRDPGVVLGGRGRVAASVLSARRCPLILHIVPRERWEAAVADGAEYRAESLEREGFIHFSTPGQVLATARRHFAGQRDLLLVTVDPRRLVAELRYEEVRPGERFPHLHGPLNLDAVTAVTPFDPFDDDG